jgi:hypothetical protein
MSVLIKKPFLTGLAIFILTVFWGSLGFTALYKHLPAFVEWTLCFLSPFAFTTGMAQVRREAIVLLYFIKTCLSVYMCVSAHAKACHNDVCMEVRGQCDRYQFSPSTMLVVGIKPRRFYLLSCLCCPTILPLYTTLKIVSFNDLYSVSQTSTFLSHVWKKTSLRDREV